MMIRFPYGLAARLRPAAELVFAETVRRPRGIWFSELFAFHVWCQYCGVSQILESGIYEGQSTEVLARLDPNRRIVSVDQVLRPGIAERLHYYSNVVVFQGSADSLFNLGKLHDPIALLCDGPKGASAVDLARRGAKQWPTLMCFSAFHDVYDLLDEPQNLNRQAFETLPLGQRWATDDPEFVSRFRGLDDGNIGAWCDELGNGKLPYVSERNGVTTPMRSYGPTLGFWFP